MTGTVKLFGNLPSQMEEPPSRAGATNCSYLDTYKTIKESAELFRSGSNVKANEKFKELTVKAQAKFFDYCSKGNDSLAKKSNNSLRADSQPKVNEAAQKQFRNLTSEDKATKMERFLQDSVAQKLQNECVDAKTQGDLDVRATEFAKASTKAPKNVNLIGSYLCIFLGLLLAFISYSKGKCLVQQGTTGLSRTVNADDTQLISLKAGHSTGIAHMQGKRPTMQDTHLATTISFKAGDSIFPHKAEVYAIFDGHAGIEASEYLRDHFAEHLEKSLEGCNAEGISDAGKFAAFKEAFINVNKAYEEANKSKGHVGSTATVAVIIGNELWVANVGDSRTVLSDGKTPIQCSEDQKCDNRKYIKGVEDRGGGIGIDGGGKPRVDGTLSTARAVGDNGMKGCGGECAVVHTPKITKFKLSELKPNSVLILGCDGLWDVCTTKQAVDFVNDNYDQPADVIADQLVGNAYAAGSLDNISVMVIKIGSGIPTKA